MILVTAAVRARPDSFDELLALSREHVARSRQEPGCLSHEVLLDPDDPLRLVFVERWQSKEALGVHFRVPASGEFVAQLRKLAAEPAEMTVYEASTLEM